MSYAPTGQREPFRAGAPVRNDQQGEILQAEQETWLNGNRDRIEPPTRGLPIRTIWVFKYTFQYLTEALFAVFSQPALSGMTALQKIRTPVAPGFDPSATVPRAEDVAMNGHWPPNS
jgi:hypothetical protein